MSRREKMEVRMASLERELARLLIPEFEAVARRESGKFLWSRAHPFPSYSRRPGSDVDRMYKLETEITSLHEKLGAPMAGSPVEIIETYAAKNRFRFDPDPQWQSGGEIRFAREAIDKLQAFIRATEARSN